ncbi:MAG TPA: hypothetical protein VHF89_11475 [Solirubrobacteraceae bacterium]|nr:hypothetical protein [Solirubrobacteraceae bacterium]
MTTNAGSGATAITTSWTYGGTTSTWTWTPVEFTVTFSSGSTCVYRPTGGAATATHDSTTSPWNNEYRFDQVPLTRVGGTFAFCPSLNVTWTATYRLGSGGNGITVQP